MATTTTTSIVVRYVSANRRATTGARIWGVNWHYVCAIFNEQLPSLRIECKTTTEIRSLPHCLLLSFFYNVLPVVCSCCCFCTILSFFFGFCFLSSLLLRSVESNYQASAGPRATAREYGNMPQGVYILV